MAETAEAFAGWLRQNGRAENTVAAYRRDVAAYLRWLAANGRDVRVAGGADLDSYLRHLGAVQRSSSVARALTAIRRFHRWGAAEGLLPANAASNVDAPVIDRPPPRPALSEADVLRVVQGVTGQGLEARRDRALLLVLFRGALKATEIVALDHSDVLAGGRALRVDRGGSHPRRVPLVGDAATALAGWVHPMGRGRLETTSAAVFLNQRGQRLTRQGLWLVCRAAGERVGLGSALAPKDLRQACGAALAARGLPNAAISGLFGHGPAPAPTEEELTEVGWGYE